jgi:HEAT repeat protein
MTTLNLRQDTFAPKSKRGISRVSLLARLTVAAALCCALAVSMSDVPSAQKRGVEQPVRVTGVACGGSTISISADGSLGRAQTWQDAEGFHVVLVNGQAAFAGASCGVKTRRVGNSLELVVPVRPGATVTVEPRGQRLDLVVSGGAGRALNVENFPNESKPENHPVEQPGEARAQREQRAQPEQRGAEQRAQQSEPKHRASSAAAASDAQQSPPQNAQPPAPQSNSKSTPTQQADPQSAVQNSSQPQQGSQASNGASAPQAPAPTAPQPAANPGNAAAAQLTSSQLKPDASKPRQADSDGGVLSSLFSLTGLLVLFGVVLLVAVFFVIRRGRKRGDEGFEEVSYEKSEKVTERAAFEPKQAAESSSQPFSQFMGDRRKSNIAVPFERRKSGHGAEDAASRQQLTEDFGRNGQPEAAHEAKVAAPATAAVQFGSYRIDQEIGRLVQGKPHSVEVLSSRASDDRRAVETSLMKALRAPETDEDGRRRARMALEDYGFVARSCAQLLLGAESFERASAARSLGEMRSAHALPFLTEALYDADSVVRLECVRSLGALGLPSAIGALLDIARRHPDIPASMLAPVLTSCSVESVELNFDPQLLARTLSDENGEWFTGDVSVLAQAEECEELPEFVEDEALRVALERLESGGVETRVRAAQQLAQFHVRRAVEALSAMAQEDPEPAARSAAVTSLGLVDHESVFAPVIVALADEAREVRAAAARALSRLSFDRADAYVRVIRSADERVMRNVARACVKAGLTSQAINRLASEDRRQAFEAYSLLSLCVKAGETQPVLDTVECHRDLEVRLACINLLAPGCDAETCEQLMRIAGNGGVPERVRGAILEMVGRVSSPQPVAVEVEVE